MTRTSPVWVQNGMVIYLRIPKSSYERVKECTVPLLPSKKDVTAGILAAAGGLGTGKLTAKVEGVGDWSTAYENGEIDQWNSEIASALTQELIAELVKTLFAGE